MKYYSEILKKLYDTKEALVEAEAEQTKAKADRAERAKEVTEALKAATEAQKKANQLMREFVKDYGSFKTTIKSDDVEDFGLMDVFETDPFFSSLRKLLYY